MYQPIIDKPYTCAGSSKSGATYYDCGSCTKQFNSKGTGTASTCKTSE